MTKLFFTILFLTAVFCGSSYSQVINAPDELEAESEDSSYIKVKWDDNSNNEAGFYIERSLDDDQNFENIGSVGQNEELFYDYWVTRGRRYYYRVYAYNGELRSEFSNVAWAILNGDPYVIPMIPSNLHATKITPTSINMTWQDNSNNEDGFIVARKRVQLDSTYQYIDTLATDILTFQEVGLTPDNVYLYKLCSYRAGIGISEYSNVLTVRTEKGTIIVNNLSEVPERFFLGNNYPNPFNPSTNIEFGVTTNSKVRITIFNSIGQQVEVLLSQSMQTGSYRVKWDAAGYPSGVYFYKMEARSTGTAGSFMEMRKMILIK